MLSFDITDRNIRIIKGVENNGKIRIHSAATLNLEEEVIVNGHVRDVPRLATLINQVLKTNKMADKEAIVSISSNLTIFKELHVPKAKEQDFVKMVRAEMQSALNIDDSYSVSYIIVGDVEGENGADAVKVLATACPYEVVDCYKRVFSMLTISLRSVMIGCNCITKVLLSDAKIKAKMPLLAVQIDNNFISLNLYENNQLAFSRFASISAEDYGNSADYVFEAVNENIFRMMQFQKSKNPNEPIENVVFYGDTHEFVRLTNSLEQMGVRTSIINVPPQIHGYENLEFSVYANAIGAMFKRNRETERINLLQTDTVNNNKIKSDKSYVGMLVGAVAVSAVLVLGTWAGLTAYNASIENDIADVNAKINSAETKAKREQKKMLDNLLTQVTSYRSSVMDAYDAFQTRPYLVEKTFKTVDDTVKAASDELRLETDILNWDYVAGKVTITLKCLADEDPAQTLPALIAEKLAAQTDSFHEVKYIGYTISEEEDPDDKSEDPELLEYANYALEITIKGDYVVVDTEDANKTGEESAAE